MMEIPKEYKKGKKVKFYKAYLLNMNEKMDLHIDGDIYFLTEHNAVQYLINELKLNSSEEIIGKIITILRVSIPTDELNSNEHYMNADGLSLTLALKEFDSHDFKVTDYEIKTLEFNIDPKTELRLLSILELGKVENK